MILYSIVAVLVMLIVICKVCKTYKKDVSEPVKTIAKLFEEGDRFKVIVIENTLCVFTANIIDTETNCKTSVYLQEMAESKCYKIVGDLSWMNHDEREYLINVVRDKVSKEDKRKELEKQLTKEHNDLTRREEAIKRYMRID